MRELNKYLKASVEVNNWKFDEEGDKYPTAYKAHLDFHGKEYTMYFTVEDIGKVESYGLRSSGCEGPAELFYSMESYFEDESRREEADMLIDMMRKAWEEANYDDSPYDFLGNEIK